MMVRGRLLFFLVSGAIASIFDQSKQGQCVPITLDLCKHLPYNMTYRSNMEHDTFVASDANQFQPLIKMKCHPHIEFFICSVFVPMCPPQMPQAVKSCRNVCEEVRKDCMSYLASISLEWPDPLQCSKFPEHQKELCMKPPESDSFIEPRPNKPLGPTNVCPSPLIDVDPEDPDAVCAFPCERDVMFSAQDKESYRHWLPYVVVADLICNSLSFLTFLVDRRRFRFPERCVFYLSLCFLLQSMPSLFSLWVPFPSRVCESLPSGQSLLTVASNENTQCVISFVFSYYFGMASVCWWLMFAFTWYLSAGKKWVPEGLDASAKYVHTMAWGAPAVLVILVLVSHSIDGSELTGLCGVGHLNPSNLLFYSIAPRASLGFIGVIFLIMGIASMCKEGKSFRQRGTDTTKLDKLMVKTCVFGALYVLPAVAVVGTEAYQFSHLNNWAPNTIHCKKSSLPCVRQTRPQVHVYLLHEYALLCAFVAPLIWILSRKTLLSWQNFLCCCLGSQPVKASSRPLLDPPAPLPQAPPPRGAPVQYIPLAKRNNWQQPNHV